ncbi:MAG: DUF1883 domain-containing protein [Chloroflexi bacterium]|nr:DUF1883 domain-containing protein [Chloroflexota bacterium]MCY3582150.1 DUF1883 domain-containing protein [Chloroflexota bacterium]MCY3716923.1 DUF1883 domain-containing protein [Chloroflexota bacterium]MDE2649490.1 DUF1883 domain-containing protein [Chloroflexota bacterium]MXX84658.1 DUF1883 domain-containing protein [Chloroflexota bacterium]
MKFVKHDLRQRSGGEIVEVILKGNSANVRLMDSSNFQYFRSGRRHQYIGGHMKNSPVRLQIPRPGHWYVTVDLGGYKGKVSSSVRILPGKLRPFVDKPLSTIPSLVRNDYDRQYDVFISHASEDKQAVVTPLAEALMGSGLSVWYDDFELKIGNSLRRNIDRGIASSRFGIVVLSKAFFGKGWPNYELDGLVTKSVNGEQVLLPIWYNITKDEVVSYSPSLADKLARNTTTQTVEEIAEEIVEVVRGEPIEI